MALSNGQLNCFISGVGETVPCNGDSRNRCLEYNPGTGWHLAEPACQGNSMNSYNISNDYFLSSSPQLPKGGICQPEDTVQGVRQSNGTLIENIRTYLNGPRSRSCSASIQGQTGRIEWYRSVPQFFRGRLITCGGGNTQAHPDNYKVEKSFICLKIVGVVLRGS